jgi:predicted cupin superfamily sugar epimerase
MDPAGAEDVVRDLGLEPLPGEGGFYRETFRATLRVPTPWGERAASTAMLYLLTPDSWSALHRLRCDEVWSFHAGDPVEMLLLPPGGPGKEVVLGAGLRGGMRLQQAVPAGTWQGARLRPGGRWALLGTVCAPGFEFEDRESPDPGALAAEFPGWAGRAGELRPQE